ncbi:MAG: DNA repair protein RadA [candidate division Zixibacteria bacterium]|nr:DNA repair protein RadA [candidate division Zixibacteria bacterium]
MIPGKKVKTAYFCTQCGAEHPRWQGQCRECNAWNSLAEEKVPVRQKASLSSSVKKVDRQKINRITLTTTQGYRSGLVEFDRVLGGQLLPGMTVLLSGDPGIGKSTLMLQVAEAYSRQGVSVLYVTGEESLSKIKLRAQRLNVNGENITVVNTTGLEEITALIAEENYNIVLVDSIQTIASALLDSPPGTVGQVREAANQLIMQAKAAGFALFLVGHVTKDGLIAGPKVLEHMVDTVIYFEGDSAHLYRLLRAQKNRFGSIAEIGLFQMVSDGLAEVSNPSSYFLSGNSEMVRSGAVVTGVCEGNRPLLVEIQALVSRSSYGYPQRVAGGIDAKKLALLLAILEKRGDYPLNTHDVFVSVAGGLKLSEPALDLPVLAAIVSSLLNRPVDNKTMVVGEVGLSGEVRPVSLIDRRVAEAAKLGFDTMVIPDKNKDQVTDKNVTLVGVKDIQSALDQLIG